MNTLEAAVLLMGVTGGILGVVIALAARFFRVAHDPRVELLIELLPNANCGGCGKAGCADLARAIVAGEAKPSDCPVSSREAIASMSSLLGIDPGVAEKKVAVVRCNGDALHTKVAVNYNGVSDCASAALVGGGPKSCNYGCLGLSSCARACPFGAIEMLKNLAVVHPELCVGCGKCVSVCPRGLITLVPASAQVHVYCNSPARAAVKRKNCASPCLGCRKCERQSPDSFEVVNNLARVKYSSGTLPTPELVEAIGCPTKCLRSVSGHLEQERKEAHE